MSDFSSASDSPSPATSSPFNTGSQDTIERLGEDANRRAREFESEPQHPGDSFRGSMQSTGRDARRGASKLAREVRDRARGYAENRKQAGAERLNSIAGAVERAAQDLESESPQAAGYVRDAAGGMRNISSTLRERSVEDLIDEARAFARSQPALVFGGAVLAGLALSRFLKSSAPTRSEPEYTGAPYGGRHGND